MELHTGTFAGIGWNGHNPTPGGAVSDGYDVLGNIGEGCNPVFHGPTSKKIHAAAVVAALNYGTFENENIEWYLFIHCLVQHFLYLFTNFEANCRMVEDANAKIRDKLDNRRLLGIEK